MVPSAMPITMSFSSGTLFRVSRKASTRVPSRKKGMEKSTTASRAHVGVAISQMMSSSPSSTLLIRFAGVTTVISSSISRPSLSSAAARMRSRRSTEKPTGTLSSPRNPNGATSARVPARNTPVRASSDRTSADAMQGTRNESSAASSAEEMNCDKPGSRFVTFPT